MKKVLKSLLGLLVAGLGLLGCGGNGAVRVDAGTGSGVAYERVAIQKLSEALKTNPSATQFEVYWNNNAKPGIRYDRSSKKLVLGSDKTSFDYTNTTDEAIHAVASKKDAITSLTEHGATQTFMLNGEPYKPERK